MSGMQTVAMPEKPALVVTVNAVDPLKVESTFPGEKPMLVNVISVPPAVPTFANWIVLAAAALLGPFTTTFVPLEVLLLLTALVHVGQMVTALSRQFRSLYARPEGNVGTR